MAHWPRAACKARAACKGRRSALPVLTYRKYAALRFSIGTIFDAP